MQLEIGKVVEGVVTGITKFGAFVDIGEGKTGLVHISEISNQYVKEVSDHLQNGQNVKVKILGETENGKLNLSIRRAVEDEKIASTDRAAQKQNDCSNRDRRAKYGEKNGKSSANNRYRHSDSAQPTEFEDMLSKFMHSSDEKLSGIRKQPNNRRGVYQKKGGK